MYRFLLMCNTAIRADVKEIAIPRIKKETKAKTISITEPHVPELLPLVQGFQFGWILADHTQIIQKHWLGNVWPWCVYIYDFS